MTRGEALKLVQELLDLYANENYPTIHLVMIYQRGYLTGILADLIRSDPQIERKIRNKIANHKKK